MITSEAYSLTISSHPVWSQKHGTSTSAGEGPLRSPLHLTKHIANRALRVHSHPPFLTDFSFQALCMESHAGLIPGMGGGPKYIVNLREI